MVNNEPMAWEDDKIAMSVARRIGNKARVEYIDDALHDLQPYLLSIEAQKDNSKWLNRVKARIWRRK